MSEKIPFDWDLWETGEYDVSCMLGEIIFLPQDVVLNKFQMIGIVNKVMCIWGKNGCAIYLSNNDIHNVEYNLLLSCKKPKTKTVYVSLYFDIDRNHVQAIDFNSEQESIDHFEKYFNHRNSWVKFIKTISLEIPE